MSAIRTLLIANRGEIARRVMRTARRMGIATVAVYSDADSGAPHVREADRAVRLGPAPAAESYLRGDAIIAAARATSADAIHPGYGFLSENAEFAQGVVDAGLVWVGPPAAAIRAMGLKGEAKRLMEEAGVPIVPGYHGDAQDEATLREEAARIGYPLLIKAVAGGGGKGMRAVKREAEFADALGSAKREAANAFGNDRVLIERLVQSPRHIEVQVLADAHGRAIALGTRDCSLQRRHQKVIEEAPAPGLTPALETAILDAARRAAEAVDYVNAGTIEFIADGAKLREALDANADSVPDGAFAFMEMNTRLQVEHPVTEEQLGIDLVEWQLRVVSGERLPSDFPPRDRRPLHAVEARLYAEDAANGFLPATGTLHRLYLPGQDDPDPATETQRSFGEGWERIDAGVREGDTITPHYDPMIAKVIAVAHDRAGAIQNLSDALADARIAGLTTNLAFLRRLLDEPDFRAGTMDTGLIGRRGEALTADPPADAATLGIAAMAASAMLPPAARAGFRLWGRARAHVELIEAGDRVPIVVIGPDRDGTYAIEAETRTTTFRVIAASVTSEGASTAASFAAELAVDGEGDVVDRHHHSVILHPGERPGERAVTVMGTWTHRFTIPDPLSGSATSAAAGDVVLAPMPGTLIALDVAEGDTVEEGQRLAVLEAMKMEHSLKAPRAGTVASVSGSPGSSVAAGDAIITLASE